MPVVRCVSVIGSSSWRRRSGSGISLARICSSARSSPAVCPGPLSSAYRSGLSVRHDGSCIERLKSFSRSNGSTMPSGMLEVGGAGSATPVTVNGSNDWSRRSWSVSPSTSVRRRGARLLGGEHDPVRLAQRLGGRPVHEREGEHLEERRLRVQRLRFERLPALLRHDGARLQRRHPLNAGHSLAQHVRQRRRDHRRARRLVLKLRHVRHLHEAVRLGVEGVVRPLMVHEQRDEQHHGAPQREARDVDR